MIGWNTDTEGGVTNEELNRKIAKARNHWFICGGAESTNKPHDWTGSEDCSAVLLEEMPNPGISRGVLSVWSCIPDILDLRNEVQYRDRKTAIALAWLKWKGIE